MKTFMWKRYIIDPNKEEDNLWKKLKEPKVEMDVIVDKFCDNSVAKVSAGPKQDVIKVTGPREKNYFSPNESKNVQMSLPRCPRPDHLIESLTLNTPGLVSNDQFSLLKRIWPKESPLSDLVQLDKEKEKDEIWGRAE